MTPAAKDRRLATLATALVAAAVFYRVLAVTGDMHFDPVVYAQNAYNILQGTFTLKTDSWFAHRLTVFLPAVPLYALFGVGTWTSKIWPLFASICQIAVVLWFGWRRLGPGPALLATGFLAFSPLDVLYSSVLNPDILIAAFLTAAAVAWIEAVADPGRPSRLGTFLAGVFFALAFVTRVFAVILLVFFALHWLWRRPGLAVLASFAAGALVVFVPLGLAYAVETGDPLYRLGVVSGRYGAEVKSEGAQLLYYADLLLHPRHTITGLAPHLYVVGLIAAVLRPTRTRVLLLLWGLPILLYLQFGSMSSREYIPILKRERFLLPLSAPLFLLAGDGLWALCRTVASRVRSSARGPAGGARLAAPLAVVGLLAFATLGSLIVRDQTATGAAKAASFEDVARLARSWPDLPILCDHWRTGYRLSYYLDFEEGADFYRGADDTQRMGSPGAFGDSRIGYLRWFANAEAVPAALIVLDDEALALARAGSSPTQTYRPEEIPEFIEPPPPDWSLLGRFGTFRVFLNAR